MEKGAIRERVWATMEAAGVARFPLPLRDRIPNFQGAEAAARRLAATEAWRRAARVKANPDSPQRPARALALAEGKTVYMAVPRLRALECFLELDPHGIARPARAASIRGAFAAGRPRDPRALGPIDLILIGSVAVDRWGGRLGKGGGFSDLEYAILRTLGVVAEGTPIATTVHPLQVIDEPLPMEPHDIPVDLIATPEGLLVPPAPRPRPQGIEWGLLTEAQIAAMPILAALRGAA